MTYYILAAQTIYFKYYFNKSSFCRSIEISGSLAPRQSIKVLAYLICPRHNNQCKTQWELQATLTLRVRLAWNKESQVNIDCSFDTCSIKWECWK